MLAIRGAIFVNEDTPQEIEKRTKQLMDKIFRVNSIEFEEVVAVIFSVTPDLRSMNPATVFRKSGHAFSSMCFQEADFTHSPKRVLRVMVLLERNRFGNVVHVYENGAESLKEWRWSD